MVRTGIALILIAWIVSVNAASVPLAPSITTPLANVSFIDATNEKVNPRVIIWIQITLGWSIKPSQVLIVREDASFEWTRTIGKNEPITLSGHASAESITTLRSALKSAPVGILADDGGIMQARWQDNQSTEHSAEFDLLDGHPGAELLARIKDFLDSQQ